MRRPLLLALLAAAMAAAVVAAAPADPAPADGPTFYISADQVEWRFAPNPDVDMCSGQAFNEEEQLFVSKGIGNAYQKARYQEYTDEAFTTLKERPAEEEHLAMLGPLLRASVGQTLTVVLRNTLPFALNLEPAGAQAVNGSDVSNAPAPEVAPGATATLRFVIPPSMGPTTGEPSAKLWLYRSTVDVVGHANAGLIGPLLVSNSPEDHSGARDIVTILQIVNENSSPLLEANMRNRTAADLGLSDADLEESNLKHGINGQLFCQLKGLKMKQGENVRWHMASVGTEVDIHNLHFHGNTFLNSGHRADQLSMIPGTVRSMDFSTENAGTWLLHCHIGDHIVAGMKAMYTVEADASLPQLSGVREGSGVVRRYYVASEDGLWDFAPQGGNMCSGEKTEWTPEEAVFTGATAFSPGSKVLKVRYVEYTDDSFTTVKPRSDQDAYLGMLGPIFKGEVGDTIEVLFKNKARFPTTLHPHGVHYEKDSEGSPYADGTSGDDKADDGVPTDGTHLYTWHVTETSGPGPADPSSVVWMVHSHMNEVEDVYAGLISAIIITRKGWLKEESLTAKDVDREVVLFFMVDNEAQSLMTGVNVERIGFPSVDAWAEAASADITTRALALAAPEPAAGPAAKEAKPDSKARRLLALQTEEPPAEKMQAAAPAAAPGMVMAEGYDEAWLKHIINGFLYCNGPPLTFTQGERVRFHVMALGTEVDMHTPNLMHSTMHVDEQSEGALIMMPGAMRSADVVMTNPGNALVQCRVADHIAAGMQMLVQVKPSAAAEKEEAAAAADATVTKTYYVQAEPTEWNYAPSGKDGCTNAPFSEDAKVFVERTDSTIGSKYKKAVYRGYTDDTFTKQVPAPPSAGLLGPTLVVEVGQKLQIVFKNALSFPANLMLDGGLALLSPEEAGAPVAPGQTVTYSYVAPASAGPSTEDLSTVGYTYTSSVDLVGHPNAGLIGVLMVGAPGAFDTATDVPTGVDAMVPLLFNIFNEGSSPLLGESMKAAGVGEAATTTDDWEESNLMHSINGMLFCNLPGLSFARGATVRFVLLGMGSEADMHSPVFKGQVLKTASSAHHTAELMPTVVQEVDVLLEQAGSWALYCLVHDHYSAGMRATVTLA